MTARLASMIKKNGTTARTRAGMLTPEIPEPTNKLTPSGGVIKPIDNVTIIMIPKWIGSIPNSIATGKRIGVKIITAADVSMKQPIISSSKMINRIIVSGLSDRDRNTLATACGIFSMVSIVPKALAVPIMIRIATELRAASEIIFGN